MKLKHALSQAQIENLERLHKYMRESEVGKKQLDELHKHNIGSHHPRGKPAWNSGKKLSEEHKKKLRLSHIGKTQSPDTIAKRVIKLRGHHMPLPMKLKLSAERKGKHISSRTEFKNGHEHSIEVRKKFRIYHLQRIADNFNKGLPVHPCIGKHETPILDFLERKCFNYKILRQYNVDGYFLDGYCSELNLAIEIDEPPHFKKKQLNMDAERQEYIRKAIGCRFLRIALPTMG